MEQRTILHADLNHYFAAVELLSHPEWRGKPLAVCGDPANRHGIVLAKSPEAKQYGVRTGEVIWQAKLKCPDLIIAPTHFEKYLHYARLIRQIYLNYTDLVEAFGLDECWLDITQSMHLFGTGEEVAHLIRRRIKAETGLTVSVGVSFCKIFAKLGSDLKKPDAVTIIPHASFRSIVWTLPVEEIMGVGPATLRRLNNYNICTLGDLAQLDYDWIQAKFGVHGVRLWQYVNGDDQSKVSSIELPPTPLKSIGHGTTCKFDLTTIDQVGSTMQHLATDIARRLRKHHQIAHKLHIDLRTNDFHNTSLQCALPFATSNTYTIKQTALQLFQTNYDFKLPLRAITLCVSGLVQANTLQQRSFLPNYVTHCKYEKIEAVKDFLYERYHKTMLTSASSTLTKSKQSEEIDVFTLPNPHHL